MVNADQQFTIIASELDPTSDRIVEFLAESYGVPINAVFFRHFSDGDRQYLARTWLLDPNEATTGSGSLSRLRLELWCHPAAHGFQGPEQPKQGRTAPRRQASSLPTASGSLGHTAVAKAQRDMVATWLA